MSTRSTLPSAAARRATIAAVLVAGCLAGSRDVSASALDVYGFGPAGVAEINARSARADDGTAAFYNPGGLGLGRGYRVEVAPILGVSALRAQGEARPLEEPFGVALAIDATIPLEAPLKDRIRFGFGGYFLPASALRLIARPAEEPLFPYYENRTQRLVLLTAIAARITEGLGVGVALNMLAGVSGEADVRPRASGAPEPRIDVDAGARVAVNVGLRFDPAPHVRLALVYRQRFSIPSLVATTAEVGGVPLDVVVDVREALFDPHTIVVASSFDVGRASVEIDASYSAWSSYEGPFVAVRAELPGVRVASDALPDLFRDVVSARAAATYRLDLGPRVELTARAGIGFETSMLTSARQGRTNLVDGDKGLFGLGATLALRDLLPRTLRVGLGVGAQIVASYEQHKRACAAQPCPLDAVAGPDAADPGAGITNPGYPKLHAGGALLSASLGLGVDL